MSKFPSPNQQSKISNQQSPPRYIMIGGFLGAGKSTAVLALGEHLRKQGLRVGLITNDQSVGLVDTALMKSHGFEVQEIAGGCFCCRFDSLVEAAEQLQAEQVPDVFIAEPVGSCTDLVATVSYPLRRIYGKRYTIAPLSVMVDPIRAERILGLDDGKSFSPKVVYVYRKQLEEASLIVINKADLLDAARLSRLTETLTEQFPQARVLAVSVREQTGLEAWFDRVMADEQGEQPTMAIDYQLYAEGEALLGWLNATLRLEAEQPIDGEVLMMNLAERIKRDLQAADGEVAHLKMTLMADDHQGHVGTLNLVRSDFVAELSQSLPEKLKRGTLVINLRAEADPQLMLDTLETALAQESAKTGTITIHKEHVEHFRPAAPTPRYRMTGPTELTAFTASAPHSAD
ncbi:MAG: GTP-binding protein [Phycisphaeraceae bacterium]